MDKNVITIEPNVISLHKTQKSGFIRNIVKHKTLCLMALPCVLFYIVFSYIPMAGIVVAFKNFDYALGIFKSPWVGFDNFKFFFMTGAAKYVTINTLSFNSIFLIVNLVLQISIAVFLSELKAKYYKKLTQSLMFLPYFISWVVAGAIITNIFNYEFGAMNSLLKSLGLDPVDVYSNVGVWKYILVAASAWKWVGYGSVIYLAAIMGIDTELYEASFIDGANIFHKIRYITIPLLMPQVFVLSLMQIGRIFRGDFEMFYQVTGNNPMLYQATDVIDTYVFRSLMDLQEFGMSAAMGVYQSVMCFIILMVSNAVVRKYQKDYALF